MTKNKLQKVTAFELLERVLFFKKMRLFQNIPGEKLMHLAEVSQVVHFRKDDIVSRQGALAETLYIIKDGFLRIEIEQNGVKTIVSRVGSGETYGEIGLFSNAPRSASAIAEQDSTLFLIRRGPLRKLVVQTPEIANNFLEFFSEKLKNNGQIIANMNRLFTENNVEIPLLEIPKVF